MYSFLPWILLATTITVRVALSRKLRWGFYLDFTTVPLWITYYWINGDPQLMIIPVFFGWLDFKAITKWWRS